MRLDSGMSLQQEVGWTRDMLRMTRYLAEIQDEPFIVCSLANIGEELENWNTKFPSVRPTFHIGSNLMPEVQRSLHQLGLELHVRNKNDVSALAQLQLVDSSSCNVVYSCSTKLGSHIKAAKTAGVQIYYVDSVREMEKIRKVLPSARIVIEVNAGDSDNSDSLDDASGAKCSDVKDLIKEAGVFNLEIIGIALNLDVTGCLDHDENLVKIKSGLKIAETALKIAQESNVDVKQLHLGQICRGSAYVPDDYVSDINTILCNDIFSRVDITADASHFLVSSSVTLATRITSSKSITRGCMNYCVNESAFGAFAENFSSSECCFNTPLPLGGGGNRKGHLFKLLDAEIRGTNGDNDIILPEGDIILPEMETGDWLLFPNMGTMNLSEYSGSNRKIIGNSSFVSIKQKTATKGNKMDTLCFTADSQSVFVDLDLFDRNQNCNAGVGLKGEIDLRKTFIYED